METLLLQKDDRIYWKECYRIVGAAMNVHSILGSGFLEGVYQEALSIEMKKCGIPFEEQKELRINYNGITLQKHYVADFLCFDKIIVEIKATKNLAPEHYAQVMNYLKATNKNCGLLINFGESSLDFKKIIHGIIK